MTSNYDPHLEMLVSVNQLLCLMDREQESLTQENNHSAAALMRLAAEAIRTLREREAKRNA